MAQTPSLINALLPNLNNKSSTVEQSSPNTEFPIIKSIKILGTVITQDKDILSASTLKAGDPIQEHSLEMAEKKIKRLGNYTDVSITSTNNPDTDITITVKETPIISEIIVTGNSTFTDDFIYDQLQSKANTPYNLKLIRNDIQFLESEYKKAGFLEAKIIKVQRPKTNKTPLIFYIAEGLLQDISITGNIKTKDYVILRELDLRPGDTLTKPALQSNLRKVFNLNYFNNITPEIIPANTPNAYVLNLNIEEKETSGAFTFGGGYAPNSGFNIFSDLYWDNIMGTGQLIMLKGNFGLGTGGYDNNNTTYQFKYHNPWAFGKHKSLTFRTWLTSGSFSAFNFASSDFAFTTQKRRGADIAIGIPHTYDVRSSHKVKYESVYLSDSQLDYNIYSYTAGLSIDKRDQKMNPQKGHYHTFSIEQGFRFRKKAIDFTQIDLTLRKFIPTFKDQTLAIKTAFGYIRSPKIANEDLFVAQYYYVGGSNTVRGYLDSNPFAYGNKQVLSTIEYRFILKHNLSVYLFADAGYATKYKTSSNTYTTVPFTDLSQYKVSKGIGVKFVIPPLGPIKLDYGITEDKIGRIQFNLGYAF